MQLEDAGWDPDMVDDYGYIKDEVLQTPRNADYLMNQQADASQGVVSIFGHDT